MTRDDIWKDTGIADPQALNSKHLQIRIHNTVLLVLRHLAGRSRVVDSLNASLHELLNLLVRHGMCVVVKVGAKEARVKV